MTLQKNDFIEIEFTGKIRGGKIFDSNVKTEIEKSGLKAKAEPFIFSIGQGMFLKGIDDFLIGKEPNKTYNIELSPENAFGLRDLKQIQLIPMKIFTQNKLNPSPGALFNFDGRVAKVLSVSGGRIRVDFNHPLAGQDLGYEIKILRKVDDISEKINAFNDFLFKKKFKFEIKDKKLILEVDAPLAKFVELFKEKFKDIFNLELEVKESKQSSKE